MLPKLKAMSVHLLTASGVVCALFALRSAIGLQFEQSFLWLGLALFIDGIDGVFARRYQVKTLLPHVSGEVLDLCVDYVTYVFVPALMLLLADKLHGAWGFGLAALICVTSLYHFSDTGSKTDDNCFVGFPAVWNIVAFYIFALEPPAWTTSALILLCCAVTFVPWKWVHPMRVTALRGVTSVVTVLWAVAATLILWSGFPAPWAAATTIILVAVYGVGLSLHFGRAR